MCLEISCWLNYLSYYEKSTLCQLVKMKEMEDLTVEKYVVIGGQYRYICYGICDSLHAAKCLASYNMEYWDNWQGWHYPAIYRELDTIHYNSDSIPNQYAIVPKDDASPIATRRSGDRSWNVCH